jgi:preprotein translocase subunit SecD
VLKVYEGREMPGNLKGRLILFAFIIAGSILLLVPTFARIAGTEIDKWPFSRSISLGLDLSGGVSITYEVQAEEAIVSFVEVVANELRQVLLEADIAVNRVRAREDGQLYVLLNSKLSEEKAIAKVDELYPDFSVSSKSADGERYGITFLLSEVRRNQIMEQAVSRAVESLRNRVDQFGVAEPLINKVGERRILLQMPGFSDIDKVKRVIGKTAKLEFRFLPSDTVTPTVELKAREGDTTRVEERVVLSGDKVKNATVNIAPGHVGVDLELTREGAKMFGRLTGENVGRRLAIVLDGVVYSSPVIREQISGGTASISGEFSLEEAEELSIVLKSGALPASLKELDQLLVGASLGGDSIRSGILAIIGGFVVILVFMAWYYRMAGLIAGFTLLVNLFVLLATLSLFGATLTLPGLAGLALTVGMAVDSNVIIFERIRDELKRGMSGSAAVGSGFDKAFSAIIDTNLSALIAGTLLFLVGTGPVKGFAVTLSIGVFTTILGAVFVAKLAFDLLLERHRDGKISI